MIELLNEGLASAFLPCSIILLLPGAAAALAPRSKEAAWALGGFFVSTAVFSWLRFSGRLDIDDRLAALALAASVGLLVLPLVRRLNVVAVAGGAFAGAGSAILWQPCVGANFGSLLGELDSGGPLTAAKFGVYLLGVLAPLVVIGGVLVAIPAAVLLPVRPILLTASVAVLGGLALATILGFHETLIGKLLELSTT